MLKHKGGWGAQRVPSAGGESDWAQSPKLIPVVVDQFRGTSRLVVVHGNLV